MSDTVGGASAGPGESRDVSAMLMPELRRVAGGLGIKSAGMKKADLVAAVRGAQSGGQSGGQSGRRDDGSRRSGGTDRTAREDAADRPEPSADQPRRSQAADRARRDEERSDDGGRADGQPGKQREDKRSDAPTDEKSDQQAAQPGKQQGRRRNKQQDGGKPDAQDAPAGEDAAKQQGGGKQQKGQGSDDRAKQSDRDSQQPSHGSGQQPGNQQAGNQQSGNQSGNQQSGNDADEDGGTRRNRRRRGRERQQPTGGAGNGGGAGANRHNRNEPDTTILDDDVLLPCAGILDVLDNYAFVRTTGYLPGPDDVYVSLSMVRKLGLRPGDAISGQVRLPREGERREKFNPLVKIDSVNGADPELGRSRKAFGDLTPLYPTERLRMETRSEELIGRVLDVAAPVGKGQRGLVVAPSRAGRTTVLRAIADAISVNNPECHLMVVLIDERPEEVTDFERSVKGEVISSTFDRPPSDHTAVAELAIERAKRLVELEHDVVVLLDGITTLGRAYNLAAPASGRTLDGGVDATALYPPKKFFGAARNIENGGSLTIVATASVESGSAMDEVIFEEFQGTSTMELRLRRDLADRWLFPAVDVVRSGTRREELLMGEEEVQIVRKLRRALSSLEPQRGLEMVLARMGHTRTNYEFLSQVQRAGDAELTTVD